jgi:hypothetical protein
MQFLNDLLNNKIILIIIILFIVNYLTKGTLLNIIKKYINKFLKIVEGFDTINNQKPYPIPRMVDNMYASTPKSSHLPYYNAYDNEYTNKTFPGIPVGSNTTPSIISESDFVYIYKPRKNDTTVFKLYNFLQSLLTNYNTNELTTNGQISSLNNNELISVKKYLYKILNCGEFRFKNINFLDAMSSADNMTGKEITPFRFSSNVYINNMYLGKMIFNVNIFIRMDTTFSGPISSGYPTIINIKLLNRDENYDATNDNNDSDMNSDAGLIPDSINFSTDSYNTQTDE